MSLMGSNHTYSGRYNRRLVFDLIRSGNGISRRDLVDVTGLKPQTMSNICKDLIDRSVVVETIQQEGARCAAKEDVGQSRGRLLPWYSRRSRRASGHRLRSGGRELGRETASASLEDPSDTIRAIADMTQRLRSVTVDRPARGIGIAMPTLQEAEFEHPVGPPGWDAWSRMPVAEAIEDACGLPTIVENDATAAAVAELRVGSAGGLSHYVHIFVGHGLGAGIINDSMPLEGFWNNAGEIGLLTWPAELANPDAGKQTPFSIDELAAMLSCESREIARLGH